jgi:hypothetical protein
MSDDPFVTDQKELSDEVERLRRITRTALLEVAEDSHVECQCPAEPDVHQEVEAKYFYNKVATAEESVTDLSNDNHAENPLQSHLQSADANNNSAERHLPLVSVHNDPEQLVLIEPMPANKQPSSFKLKRKKLSEFMDLNSVFYRSTFKNFTLRVSSKIFFCGVSTKNYFVIISNSRRVFLSIVSGESCFVSFSFHFVKNQKHQHYTVKS